MIGEIGVTASPAEDLLAYQGEVFINFRNVTYQWVGIKVFALPEIPANDDAVLVLLLGQVRYGTPYAALPDLHVRRAERGRGSQLP
jgi:hypothetical protein